MVSVCRPCPLGGGISTSGQRPTLLLRSLNVAHTPRSGGTPRPGPPGGRGPAPRERMNPASPRGAGTGPSACCYAHCGSPPYPPYRGRRPQPGVRFRVGAGPVLRRSSFGGAGPHPATQLTVTCGVRPAGNLPHHKSVLLRSLSVASTARTAGGAPPGIHPDRPRRAVPPRRGREGDYRAASSRTRCESQTSKAVCETRTMNSLRDENRYCNSEY